MKSDNNQENLLIEAVQRIESQLRDLQAKLDIPTQPDESGQSSEIFPREMSKPFFDSHRSIRTQSLKLFRTAKTCLVITLVFILLIIGDCNLFATDSISSNVGKIIFVLLTVTFCVFCLKQYNKQSVIAQDYAFKVALLDSLRPISEELGSIDVKIRNEYIDSLSTEISKNPLRYLKKN